MSILFCSDATTIFYPTAPGRVHCINFGDLAAADGSDDKFADATHTCDIEDMVLDTIGDGADVPRMLSPIVTGAGRVPYAWLQNGGDAAEFDDALEMWADWADRDSARLDSLDACKGALRAA